MRPRIPIVLVALAALLLSRQCSAYVDPPWIFGMHDPGGESNAVDKGKRCWVLCTEEIGHDPNNQSGGDYRGLTAAGHGVIVRLNNGYSPNGTIPNSAYYSQFATRCANFVRASLGNPHIWIIGNEMNLSLEWPPGEQITPTLYASCFLQCRNAIRNVTGHENDQVICGALSPSGAASANWFNQMMAAVGSNVDGFAIHAYTSGSDPNLIFSEAKSGGYYTQFRSYRDLLNLVPTGLRSLPAYITETDQGYAWLDANNGWVRNCYTEINNWNRTAGNQRIRAVCLYRWPNYDQWYIDGKQGVINDWRDAMQNDYRWEYDLGGTLTGYVRTGAGQGIAGARVVLSPGGQSADTQPDGGYRISGITGGLYSVTASKQGYYPQTYSGVVVTGGLTQTRDFAMQAAPDPISILNVTPSVSSVRRGETGILVTMTVRNAGVEDVRLTESRLTFAQGTQDVSSHYFVTPDAANPDTIYRDSTVTLNFVVRVGLLAPAGPTKIDGYVAGWPNACPNGSYEQGTSTPERWSLTNALGGGSGNWALDSAQKTHGTRSLNLSVNNCSSGYIQAHTGLSSSLLLPIQQNTLYTLSCQYRSVLTGGTASPSIGYQEYGANYLAIGSPKLTTLSHTSSFSPATVSFIPSANAAYVRALVRVDVTAAGTTASAWYDDVQLRDGRVVFDSAASSPGSWTAQGSVATPISEAKALPDGTAVAVSGIVVGRFPVSGPKTSFYVEAPDRSCGIQVVSTSAVDLGDAVLVSGTMNTSNGERILNAAAVSVYEVSQALPDPVFVTNRALGGGSFGLQGAVLDNASSSSYATGLNNVGLLVTACGRVKCRDTYGNYFYIDDGSGLSDGSPCAGVRVASANLTMPAMHSYSVVTGLSGTTLLGGKAVRLLRPRSQTDIR